MSESGLASLILDFCKETGWWVKMTFKEYKYTKDAAIAIFLANFHFFKSDLLIQILFLRTIIQSIDSYAEYSGILDSFLESFFKVLQ